MSDASLEPSFAWWLIIHCFNTKPSLSSHQSPVLHPVLTELVAHGPTSSVFSQTVSGRSPSVCCQFRCELRRKRPDRSTTDTEAKCESWRPHRWMVKSKLASEAADSFCHRDNQEALRRCRQASGSRPGSFRC